MLKMRFWRFLLFDAAAACISMPVVFFIAYGFGPRLQVALEFILRIRSVTTTIALSVLLALLVFLVVYLVRTRRRLEEPPTPGSR